MMTEMEKLTEFDSVGMMLHAYIMAQNSNDDSTQNSALLLTPNNMEVICASVNCVPSCLAPNGMDEFRGIDNRNHKYDHTIHAEVSAIGMAAQLGVKTKGLIMFAPWATCKNCAKIIIAAGIAEVWTHNLIGAHNQWNDDVKKGLELMKLAGVKLHMMDGKLDPDNKIWIRRNYELLSP